MLEIQHIVADTGPKPVGPFSHAVKAGDFVFVTGQMPTKPDDPSRPVEGGIEAQIRQVFANLNAVAMAAGGSLDNSVKINISLTDLANFQAVNAVMAEVFKEPYPARACVQVAALPKGVQVEIEAILAI